MRAINLLKPKAILVFVKKDTNLLVSKKNKSEGLKMVRLAVVYSTAFVVIMLVLNSQYLFQRTEYFRNQLSDRDEILETRLLSDYYHQLEEKRRSIIPAEAEENLTEDNSLFIPKINIRSPIISGRSTDSDSLLEDLKSGTVIYPGSSLPGTSGSTVILGHSSSDFPWTQYSNIFSLLYKLEKGDLIYLRYGGEFFVYSVGEKKTGSVFTLSSADIDGDLILSSCWPVGTDKGRILVTADLIERLSNP